MTYHQILNNITPKKLFLIDSLGALLSAIWLGLILARFESTFGMPPKTLYLLSGIAVLFCIYSFSCFLLIPKNWNRYMKAIAFANLIYGCLTCGLVFFLYDDLTILGLAYFVLELVIVIILVFVELRTAYNYSPDVS